MRIFCSPKYPDKEYYLLTAIIHHLDYTVTLVPDDDFDFAIHWNDTTHPQPPAVLQEIARRKPVLNLHCTDISKRRVEEVFQRIFGYGSFVDPATYHGRFIRKADENAVGGGQVLHGPLENAADGFVYQKLIETEQDGVQVEYRTPVILGTIPEVKIWRREVLRDVVHERKWLSTTTVAVDEVYTPEERDRILALAAALGLDFGEVDVLRSRDDGRLYVLDANNTPSGYGMLNRVQWKPADKKASIASLGRCLDGRVRALLDAGERG